MLNTNEQYKMEKWELRTRIASIRKPRRADVLPLSRNYRCTYVKCEFKT